MKRVVVLICLVSLAWLIGNLPASLVRHLAPNPGISFVAPQGTLWNGSATVISHLGISGDLHWQTHLSKPEFEYRFVDGDTALQAQVSLHWSAPETQVQGTLAVDTLAPLLKQYDLFLSGRFDLQETDLNWPGESLLLDRPAKVIWSGGPVRYVLANTLYSADMPPMLATVSATANGGWQAAIDPLPNIAEELGLGLDPNQRPDQRPNQSSDRPSAPGPSLLLRITAKGALYIGVSRGLLRIANFPWPGNEADDELVFEMERFL